MKYIFLGLLSLVHLTAIENENPSSVRVEKCEAFVSRIMAYRLPVYFKPKTVRLYVSTSAELSGSVTRVSFKHKRIDLSGGYSEPSNQGLLRQVNDAKNLWFIELYSIAQSVYEGQFEIETREGKTYILGLKTTPENKFVITDYHYPWIVSAQGGSDELDETNHALAASTTHPVLRYFNSHNCHE